jgi:hypothetical protein
MAFRTRDYGDVLRVFNHSCKFKTVRRILLPLNISWEGITLGTGCHWMLAELHLDTSTTHLYDWFKKTHDQYEIMAGVATCNTAIICTPAHVCLCHTVAHSRCVLPAAPLQALLVVLHKRCVGLCVCVWCVCVCIDIYIYICYMYICMYIYIYSVILYIYIFSLSFSCSHSFSLSTHAHTCTHTHTHTRAPGCSTAHRPPGAHLPQP